MRVVFFDRVFFLQWMKMREFFKLDITDDNIICVAKNKIEKLI